MRRKYSHSAEVLPLQAKEHEPILAQVQDKAKKKTWTNSNLHRVEQLSVFVVSFIIRNQNIQFVNQLTFHCFETSANFLLRLDHVIKNVQRRFTKF